MNWEDEEEIKLKNIKSGQIFFEYDFGIVLGMVALEDCREVSDGYQCRVFSEIHKGEIELFESFDCGHYGLKLYNR